MYSDKEFLFKGNWETVFSYEVETKITISENTIAVFTEELDVFDQYTILSSELPEKENESLIMEAIDKENNEAILLLNDKIFVIIYNFKKENQFGTKHILRK